MVSGEDVFRVLARRFAPRHTSHMTQGAPPESSQPHLFISTSNNTHLFHLQPTHSILVCSISVYTQYNFGAYLCSELNSIRGNTMAPKKSRAQQSSSQPLPESSKPTRASGRKRRLSDASNASDRPSSSLGPVTAEPSKRRKKGRAAASVEPEVIVEEDEQDAEMAAINEVPDRQADLDAVAAAEDEAIELQDEIEVNHPQARHVHFGSDDATDDAHATATNITPHPRKMLTVKRRVTMSPGMSTMKRIKTGSVRSSLPPSLALENDRDAATVIQELQFAPLSAVLDERIRRRLRRSHLSEEQNDIEDHARRDSRTQQELEELRAETQKKQRRIDELAFELEAQRQAAIDVHDENHEEQQKAVRMEHQLAELRRELDTHMETHGLDADMDVDVPDHHMMVLESQEEIAYPHLPTPQSSQTLTQVSNGDGYMRDTKITLHETSKSTSGRQSLGAALQTAWDVERREFEDAIMSLSTEANDAKAALRVLTIELQGLGFGDGEPDSKVILHSIREAFGRVRDQLDISLPDTIPEESSNQDILEILIANVKEFADRLRIQDQELHDKGVLVADLGNQISGLLNHLADAEIRKNKLDTQWRSLDEQNEDKVRTIEELEEDVAALEEDRDRLQGELDSKAEEAKILGVDHAESLKNIEKLQFSLENYRMEETKLTQLITKMEQEHRADVSKMNKEREETVRDLEDKLDTENDLRSQAEEINVKRQNAITRLERQVEDLATKRDDLREQLGTTKAELVAEREGRVTAEADLDEKTVQTEDLEARVGRLEEELEKLNAELDQLRLHNDSEKRQREAAESDLDERNLKIEQLTQSLHDQGKQANELRQKLFEVQQKNAEKVKELEQEMSERDEQYQTDIEQEVQRREAADDLAQRHAATILELETKIEQIENKMRNDLAERDERIAALEEELAEKDSEIANLKLVLRSVENTLDIDRTNYAERAEELNGSILALQDTITDHETKIRELQRQAVDTTDLHNSEIEDRDAQIATLHGNVSDLQVQVDDLEEQKTGLERRVEAEAEQMLQLQNEKQDEIEALKSTITDKQAKILVVEQKAREADNSWQEVLQARDDEIDQLKQTTVSTSQVVTSLTKQHDALKDRFRDFVRRSSDAIGKLQAAVDTAKTVADDEAQLLRGEGDALMEEIEAMDELGEIRVQRSTVVKTTAVQTPQAGSATAAVAGAGKKGRGRKKRIVDSGIGMEGQEEDEEMHAA